MSSPPNRLPAWTRPELRDRGLSRRALERLISEGTLRPAGRRWLVERSCPEDVAASLRAGHRLTCVSALRHHGAWSPLIDRRHETAPRCSCATTRETAPHRYLHAWPDDAPICPIPLSLRHAACCLAPDSAAVLFESVLARRLLHPDTVEDVLIALPDRYRIPLGRLNPRAESGTETLVRRYLERRRVRVRAQVRIDGVGRVDLLVGDRLVIECDSRQYHTAMEQYADDRRRDLALHRRGFVVVRLTWEMVMLRWESTRRDLDDLLRQRRHVHRRRRTVAAQ